MGRVAGHRGRDGSVTVRVAAGDAEAWTAATTFMISGRVEGEVEEYEVESSRAYRDRLVLKLRGIDDATVAAGLKGRRVSVRRVEAAPLPDGEHYRALLVGMVVEEEGGRTIGAVDDIIPTGGVDLLRVLSTEEEVAEEEAEVLIPFVREIVIEVDESAGRIRVRMPEGLEQLNRADG